ncbi:MAG TPA: substrate-binding domain-containing protein [Synergistales bacterium]|nr:substrate-binding domain-containing protein [Synergistales bacterium]
MKRAWKIATTLVLVFLLLAGAAAAKAPVLRMATTTSTDNTGLLDYLAPIFQKDTGIELQWVAVGTGKALQYGKNGDVDVLLVHDPEAEAVFMKEGYGKSRREVMFNDFVLVGPAGDPAKVKGKTAAEALKAIAAKKAPFASRGDKSGTHMAELRLWKEAGVAAPDREDWYLSVGQGMIETLAVAGERGGYTLTDRGTYIKYESNFKGNPPLVIVVEKDKKLFNQYSVIVVDPSRAQGLQTDLAERFSAWMASPRGQKVIAGYKMMGKQLFFPNAKAQ